MPNPLDYVSQKDIEDLGLSSNELLDAYQPSGGGFYHARGGEGKGKTLFIAHLYRYLIDSKEFSPFDATGNMSFKGKYGQGFTVRKGQELREYLWNLTHVPYQNKIVIIDEADSEFPARSFTDREQTEIATRMWHVNKLHNYILMSSHVGNSTDLIFHLASHYLVLPDTPNFETNSLDFTIINNLELWTDDFTAHDIIKTMLIYKRRELTEDTIDSQRNRPIKKSRQTLEESDDLDVEAELKAMNLS